MLTNYQTNATGSTFEKLQKIQQLKQEIQQIDQEMQMEEHKFSNQIKFLSTASIDKMEVIVESSVSQSSSDCQLHNTT